ncbi:hypothetical protein ACX8XP_05195 [Calditrichota bacterium LG25]
MATDLYEQNEVRHFTTGVGCKNHLINFSALVSASRKGYYLNKVLIAKGK